MIPTAMQDLKKLIFLFPVVLLVVITIIVVLVFSNSVGNSGKIQVLAAENFYADMFSQIGGNLVQTHTILSDPNVDPHSYDLTSKDRTQIATAKVIIYNGLGYDSFMDKALPSDASVKILNVGKELGIPSAANPHVWYDINSMESVAVKMRDTLEALSPSDKATIEANYTSFEEKLGSVKAKCLTLKSTHPEGRVIATERVADYLLESCGLFDYSTISCQFIQGEGTEVSPAIRQEVAELNTECKSVPVLSDFKKAIEEGNDPSASSVTAFKNLIVSKKVAVLVYNKQAVDKVSEQMKSLASQNHIAVVDVTETMPAGATYQSWMTDELTKLESAFDKG